MKQQFKRDYKIMTYEFERITKEVIEKRFINDFFNSLPIEDLKRMVRFSSIRHNGFACCSSVEIGTISERTPQTQNKL